MRDVGRRGLRRRIEGGDLSSDHELDESGLVHAHGVLGGNAFTISQDRYSVREGENLLHAVRDVDHAYALLAKIAHHGVEKVHFLLGERSRRLVHNEDARSGSERASDLHELLLWHRKIANFCVGLNLCPNSLEKLPGLVAPLAPGDATCGRRSLQPEGDVFRHAQVGKKSRLLVDRRDSHRSGGGRIEPGHRFSFDLNSARIGLMRPGDDFDERRFAGAVLPEQGMDFASVQVKGNPLQCANGLKRLRNLAKLEEWRGSLHR